MGRFAVALAAIGVVAFAVRIGFALAVASDLPYGMDVDLHRDIADNLASGHGFTWRPGLVGWSPSVDPDLRVADSSRAPVHPVLLAAANLGGLSSPTGHRIVASATAAVGVVLVGLLGRRLVGARVGLVAAGIAAVSPIWFQHPGFLTVESTATLVVPAVLLAAAVLLDRPTAWRALGLGALIGLAALTRAELILFVGFLALPVSLVAARGLRAGARCFGLALLGTALVVGPWVVRMEREFGSYAISLNGGVTLGGANCDGTYHGEHLGGFHGCAVQAASAAAIGLPRDRAGRPPPGPVDAAARRIAIDYARQHRQRLPAVVVARAGRTIGVYRPATSIDFDVGVGGHRPSQVAGWWLNALVLLPLATAGFVVLVRRGSRRALVVLAAGPAVALATGILVYGATRLRVPAEPAIAVLAATALVAAVDRWRPVGGG